MSFEHVAETIIKQVDGLNTPENIKHVTEALQALADGINLNWEAWTSEETTDILAFDNIKCDCGNKISVLRERNKIEVLFDSARHI